MTKSPQYSRMSSVCGSVVHTVPPVFNKKLLLRFKKVIEVECTCDM